LIYFNSGVDDEVRSALCNLFFKVDFQNLNPEFKICMWLFELIDFLNIIVHYQVVLDKIRKILLGLLYFTALSKKTVLIILQYSLKNLLAPLIIYIFYD